MARKPKRTTPRRKSQSRGGSAQTSVSQAVDRTVAEGQRYASAWAAAMSVSVRAWADMMRASAEATSQAAQAFGDELKKTGNR